MQWHHTVYKWTGAALHPVKPFDLSEELNLLIGIFIIKQI